MEYDDISYKVGMIVKHKLKPEWGLGEIIKSQGRIITIDFEGEGRNNFDSEMAPLEIVRDKELNFQYPNIKDSNIAIGVDMDYFAKPDLYSLKDLQKFPPPSSPGVYGWYFDQLPPYVPKVGCVVKKTGFMTKWWLLYIGLASKSLRSRILNMHFRGNADSSSLRKSLGCLLINKLDIYLCKRPTQDEDKYSYAFADEGESKLSKWMSEHARVTWVETEDYKNLEELAIGRFVLPLNCRDNEHPLKESLSNLRTQFKKNASSVHDKPEKKYFKNVYNDFVKECKNLGIKE